MAVAAATAATLTQAAGISALVASSILTTGILGKSALDHFKPYITVNFHGGVKDYKFSGTKTYKKDSGYKKHGGNGYDLHNQGSHGYKTIGFGGIIKHPQYKSSSGGYQHEVEVYDLHDGAIGYDYNNEDYKGGYGRSIGSDQRYVDDTFSSYGDRQYDVGLQYDADDYVSDFFYRKKRSTSDNEITKLSGIEENAFHNQIKHNVKILKAIRSSDTSKCGLRLVCELAAKQKDQHLQGPADHILQFVRNGEDLVKAAVPSKTETVYTTMLNEFKEAMRFGGKGGNCSRIFSSCPHSANKMLAMLPAN